MRKMSAFLELPGEPEFREVQVILTGKRQAVIENYRNIQSYTREEILILTPSGRLVIRGKNLVIPATQPLNYVSAGRSKALRWRREISNDPGFVRVSVKGQQCQRFVNLCRGREMDLKRIIRTGETELQLTMKVADFLQISPLRRKTGVHIHILKKRGPLFFLLFCKRRKMILQGFWQFSASFFSVRQSVER